jgi:polysaccharide export outer membrane protein
MVTDFAKLGATSTPVRVMDDGSVAVPLIGRVMVAGLRMQEAEQVISGAAVDRGIFRNPAITVAMRQPRVNRITVVGAVNEPGTHELTRGASSLLDAIVSAGGLAKEAGPEVEIRRTANRNVVPGRQAPPHVADSGRVEHTSYDQPQAQMADQAPGASIKINLVSAPAEGKVPRELEDGDVVHVSKRSYRPVYVIGLVRKSGEMEYPINKEFRLLDAIAKAEDSPNPLADKVIIVRQLPGQDQPIRIVSSLKAAKHGGENIKLAPGDTVSVEQTPETIVYDTVQTFFRVGFTSALPTF